MMGILVNLAEISAATAAVTENYSAVVNDLRGEFAKLLAMANPAAAAIRRLFVNVGLRLVDKRLSLYRADLELATQNVIRSALINAGVEPDEFLKQHGKPLMDYAKELVYATTFGIGTLAKKDVKYGADQLRALSFNVLTTMSNAGFRNAVKGAVVRNIVAGANYTGRDGKPWRTIRSASLGTRHHLLTMFNETTLYVGLVMGDSEFVIRAAHATNPYDGMEITPEEYRHIKEAAFHPNANALIYRKSR